MPFVLSHPQDAAERVEGEPFYPLSCYSIQASEALPSQLRNFCFHVRAFKTLPPSDAVSLLAGTDSTGLVVWSGALALLEWLMQHPERLAAAINSSTTSASASGEAASDTHIIELGCGSGIATVGLCALLQRCRNADHPEQRSLTARAHLWATDGNPECVELAQRNVREQCNASRNGTPLCGAAASAELLPWGDDKATELLLRKCSGGTSPSSCPTVTIVSADVLYDAAAIPLLVSTVAQAANFCAPPGTPERLSKELEWWLAYAPRSLTRAGNEHIFQTLIDSFTKRGWSYEVFPPPDGTMETGFEGHSGCDTPALRGCIVVARAKAATSYSTGEFTVATR